MVNIKPLQVIIIASVCDWILGVTVRKIMCARVSTIGIFGIVDCENKKCLTEGIGCLCEPRTTYL